LVNYHLGRAELMKRTGLTREELDAQASARDKEYWDLQEKTDAINTFILAFEKLCSNQYIAPKAALNLIRRHYKTY